MILRLFLVPALIVAILVGLFLVGPSIYGLFNRLIGRRSGDARSAAQFLHDLDSPNPEIRWRAASDLAQVLLRKDALAADVPFALQLADRLNTAIQQSAPAEKDFASRYEGLSAGEKARELAKLEPDRNLIIYLAASLGNCMTPIGAPLLKQLASQESGLEPEALRERRRRALFALATLGENLKRFDNLSNQDKDAIEQELQSAVESGEHLRWAKPSLAYLQARRQGKKDTLGVAEVLEKCAGDEDPFLRELSALAANFWSGTAAEDARIEAFLVKLSNDAGAGEEQLEERLRANPDSSKSRAVTTKKGFKVQANATVALARRGSPRVRLDVLQVMLDPDALRKIFVIRRKNASDIPDEALVALTLTNALKAVAQLHTKRPEMKLDKLVPLVDALAQDGNAALRNEAEQTKLVLEKEK